MKTIENTIKAQMESVKKIDLTFFYDASFTDYKVRLQGYLNANAREYCENLGFEFSLTKHNWIVATKDNVQITLTF